MHGTRCRDSRCIRYRMSGLDGLAATKQTIQVTMFCNDDTACTQGSENLFHCRGHARGGFADGQQKDAIERGQREPQLARAQKARTHTQILTDRVRSISCFKRTLENSQRIAADTGL